MAKPRLNYDDSIRRLQELGALGPDERPPLPDHLPQPEDDEPLGLSFFRTFLGDDADLSNLTIPRTFFGRSEIRDTSFHNTDLTESNLRWNDFINVDFSDAVLSKADLRASIYTGTKFVRTDLRGADMRRGDYEDCDFDGAVMDGARMTRAQAAKLDLDEKQMAAIAWCDEDGPEPSGG
jgi:uncharacterized protein YjbI with pentapeptide repeats